MRRSAYPPRRCKTSLGVSAWACRSGPCLQCREVTLRRVYNSEAARFSPLDSAESTLEAGRLPSDPLAQEIIMKFKSELEQIEQELTFSSHHQVKADGNTGVFELSFHELSYVAGGGGSDCFLKIDG
jgi:hypothetical protein